MDNFLSFLVTSSSMDGGHSTYDVNPINQKCFGIFQLVRKRQNIHFFNFQSLN